MTIESLLESPGKYSVLRGDLHRKEIQHRGDTCACTWPIRFAVPQSLTPPCNQLNSSLKHQHRDNSTIPAHSMGQVCSSKEMW